MKKGKILIVDDNKNVLSALRIFLEGWFAEVILLSSPNALITTLKEKNPDIVLLDMNFSAGINSGNEGLYWLAQIKRTKPETPVVLFTAYADIELAVRALKEGASDFVVKPWDNAKLLATLQATVEQSLKSPRTKRAIPRGEEDDVYWGESAAMTQLLSLVGKVAATDANILITGENGTGKEVVARMIHRLSGRAAEPLVVVDMGAVTESLFESELFGHVKGAFTDAKTDRTGKFEAADKGTLFLDEIGNLSYPLQAKLLNALQSRQVTPVGSNRPVPVDIRLISATNKDLREQVREDAFREDLLYRVNTIQIEVPPLRERTEDIRGLAQFFMRRFAVKYNKPMLAIGEKAMLKLEAYQWPGNVRELQHAVEKAVILSDGAEIRPEDFYFHTSGEKPIADAMPLDEMEKIVIQKALEKTNRNISAVATQLGISRPTLYSKMKKYGLE